MAKDHTTATVGASKLARCQTAKTRLRNLHGCEADTQSDWGASCEPGGGEATFLILERRYARGLDHDLKMLFKDLFTTARSLAFTSSVLRKNGACRQVSVSS